MNGKLAEEDAQAAPRDVTGSDEVPFGKKLKRLCYRQRVLPLEVGRAVHKIHGLPLDAVSACRTAITLERGECPPALDPELVGKALRQLLGTKALGDPPAPNSLVRATPAVPSDEAEAGRVPMQDRSVPPPGVTSHIRATPVVPDEYAPDAERSWAPAEPRSLSKPRTAWMTVELTRSELERIRRAAEAVGASPEDFARDTILLSVARFEARRRTPRPG